MALNLLLPSLSRSILKNLRGASRVQAYFLLVCWLLVGCADGDRPARSDTATPAVGVNQAGDRCATPQQGCECSEPLDAVDCGQVREKHGDYVTCSMGTRTCTEEGTWSACVGHRTTLKPVQASAPGKRPLQLGAPAQCPADFDPCDPYCNVTEDVPLGLVGLPDGLVETVEGLTLSGTGAPSCTDIELEESTDRLDVSQFSPLTVSPAGPVTFSLTGFPAGCANEPFPATWVVDKPDRAIISGTNSTNGELTLVEPLSGVLRVTAFALGFSTSVLIEVKVNVLESRTSVAPNVQAASTTAYNAFGTQAVPNPGTIAPGVTWLYPYADTYFPLGLPPPVVMYWYTNSGGNGANSALNDRHVKVTLRYPENASGNPATAGYAEFNYSIVVRESNVVSQTAPRPLDSRDPQVVIPAAAWRYFELSARGNYADLVIQRNRAGIIEQESRRRIFFVDGQLKGTVFYQSYNSPLANYEGAVLAIDPGATAPRVAVQPSGRCTVCHSVNRDGTSVIANGYRADGNTWYNQSRRYDLTNSASFPNPPVQQSYTYTSDVEGNTTGNPFTWGGPWGDGTLYMTHSGCSPAATNGECASPASPAAGPFTTADPLGDPNWRAPRQFSRFLRVSAPTTAIGVTGWPSNVVGVTPRFSPDGTKLAFGFWGGSAIGSVASVAAGTRLAAVNFSCTSPPCTSASTGWSVSNARDLTPGITHRVAWPSFTPTGDSVVYQRQYRTSRYSAFGGVLAKNWSPSHINTIGGALAELWISNVPASGSGTPTQLRALNGLISSGVSSYLPEDNRSVSPHTHAFHRNAGTSFVIARADSCGSSTGTATGVRDYQLNYMPFLAPIEAGPFSWVVFTTRRMYGSVARNSPFDGAPDETGTMSDGRPCYSGDPSSKKLWVAAVDRNWTPGTDPSHPALYLPGQELRAGNTNGFWANTPCAAVGASCVTHDDCCGGTGAGATTECRVVSAATASSPVVRQCANKSSCSAAGEECATGDDCCSGLLCPAGGGVCVQEPNSLFQRQTLEREYIAECPEGTSVEWRFFEWQATIPDGTSLDFLVQTKQLSEDDYEPAMPLLVSEATSTTPDDTWHRGPTTVHDTLRADPPELTSRRYLLVTIGFNPDLSGTVAPTLERWRQVFDCVPSE